MGVPIALVMWDWRYIVTYFIATNVFVYGESSWTAKLFGHFRWFVSGFALGAASLSLPNAAWCGILFLALKLVDPDQAYFELAAGFMSTLVFTIGGPV